MTEHTAPLHTSTTWTILLIPRSDHTCTGICCFLLFLRQPSCNPGGLEVHCLEPPIQIIAIFHTLGYPTPKQSNVCTLILKPEIGRKPNWREKKNAAFNCICSIFCSQRCHIKDIEKFKPGPGWCMPKPWEPRHM